MSSGAANARTGLMLRNSLASDAAVIFAGRTGDGRLVLESRSVDGGASTLISSAAGFDTPLWLRLERSGNSFTAFSSPDGETWTEFGATEIALKDEVYGGITASGTDGITATVSSYAMARFSAAVDGRVEAENYSASFGVQTEKHGRCGRRRKCRMDRCRRLDELHAERGGPADTIRSHSASPARRDRNSDLKPTMAIPAAWLFRQPAAIRAGPRSNWKTFRCSPASRPLPCAP